MAYEVVSGIDPSIDHRVMDADQGCLPQAGELGSRRGSIWHESFFCLPESSPLPGEVSDRDGRRQSETADRHARPVTKASNCPNGSC